jgi:CheY-like chemotaxis protein
MSAAAMAEDRASCMDAGMNDFVPKPVRLQDVSAALLRASTGLSAKA